MPRSLLRLFAVCAVALLAVVPVAAHPAHFQPQVGDKVTATLAQTGTARVIIQLRDPASVTAKDAARAQAVQQIQNRVLARLTPPDFSLYRRYTYLPALAGTITPKALAALQADPNVLAVQMDEAGAGHLGQSVPALRADIVHNQLGLTGRGVTVAVLDSGVDLSHPDLSDDILAQHCFTQGNCQPGNVNESDVAQDLAGHGTNVAGIITAKGAVSARGFAPDAKLVAVRVLDKNNNGWLSDWVAGLDWVRGQQAALNIKLVNLSLGTFVLFPNTCDTDLPVVADAVAQLNALGVTLFASSGNGGSSTSLASPACNGGIVAVGATYDGGLGREPDSGTYRDLFGTAWPMCFDNPASLAMITCFTNSNAKLALVAPGARITAPGLGGGLSTYVGTSQASPTAVGVAALLLQARPSLTPDQVLSLLRTTGVPLTDAKNGVSVPRIDALAAAQAALALPAPTPAPRSVSGRVTMQGRFNQAGASVSLGEQVATTQNDGSFNLLAPPGSYEATVGHGGYLTAQRAVTVAAGGDTVVPDITLVGGDTNGDNRIDLSDLVLVAANYDEVVPLGDSRADINGDGAVGLADLTLVGANYGRDAASTEAASRLPAEASKRSVRVILAMPDKARAGDEVTVVARVGSASLLSGVDITLGFDPARLEPLGPAMLGGWLDEDHRFVARNEARRDAGEARFVAVGVAARSTSRETTLLTLRFRALVDGAPAVVVRRAVFSDDQGTVVAAR